MISGKATITATKSYAQLHQTECTREHFREINSLTMSSIGIGTYLGTSDAATDDLVTEAIIKSVKSGINLIDTAINYRSQHGEMSVKAALFKLIESQTVSRSELIICSKGGFIPNRAREKWFKQEYVDHPKFNIQITDMVAGIHCMHPEYIQDQLERSLTNLGVETIDIYYLHNPETQLGIIPPEEFYRRLKAVFAVLEKAADAGKITAYGIATWQGFRVPPTDAKHIDLAKAKSIAQQVAGGKGDRFQFIQLPVNLTMPEAVITPTQPLEGKILPAITAANQLGINAIASASIAQAKNLMQLPQNIIHGLGENLKTDAVRALQFTRSVPGLSSALVGMKSPKHITENLALTSIPPLDATYFPQLIGFVV
ncbi:MAG: aldo/keto reductase [Okeania sp. SIO2C9]|uniref:aldo/keto reductase n=1 Tax=Okeania sp. SIO2C9 TaxID=2607791 RepID=UPI0013BF21F5|nr:aldo/keto reductase [Okeania sp. SIO2C9]NEQ78344.1 aldo/keto reductase [Okeania sp. SIO2C9]